MSSGYESANFFFFNTSEETQEDVIFWIDWDGNLMIDHDGNYMIFWDI